MVSSTVSTAAKGFAEWQVPALPEDLHFLREDQPVILGSISTEDYVWLELDDLEQADIREHMNGTLVMAEPDPQQLHHPAPAWATRGDTVVEAETDLPAYERESLWCKALGDAESPRV